MKQTEEKVKGGRKCTHLVKVYLSDDEYEKLCKDAATFNRDKSKYLRLLIDWIEPVAPPSVEVKEFTRELRRLGVSMNQIAAQANTLGFVDDLEYRRYADEVMKVLGAIQQEYAKKGVKQLLANVRKYTDPQELTAQMVNDLVDKIIVHAPDKSSGHRKQKIEIYYNAVGIIDLSTVNEDDCIALHGRCKGKKISV